MNALSLRALIQKRFTAWSAGAGKVRSLEKRMPEGPEIFRAARALHQAVANQPIRLVLSYPKLRSRSTVLAGVPIVRVRARSKAILTEFADGTVLYSHNQLYGEWRIHAHDEPLATRQVRLIIETENARAVLYSTTDLAWLRAGEEDRHSYIAKLGPEVLNGEVTAKMLAARLAEFPGRIVAAALLDQNVVAGLGNYLRADILFVAGVDPRTRIAQLAPAALLRIANACKKLTARSVNQCGVVRPLAEYIASHQNKANHQTRDGNAYEASRFYVYNREGKACWTCGAKIRRVSQAGRGLFFCEVCQDA